MVKKKYLDAKTGGHVKAAAQSLPVGCSQTEEFDADGLVSRRLFGPDGELLDEWLREAK